MSEEAAAERVGSLIDERYKIVEVMASGSMGAVYKAERVPVGKIVAVKFLHASFANDSEFQARFERETRVASKLAHPNCVSVLDFGVSDGAPYLVMEYVAGTTLRARIDKGALPPKDALVFARQIAAGLAHAHEQGVIHRDIKPANIMITDEIGTGERVRILDFGLARLRGNVGRDATQTNMVVGTPNYMAPEQTVPAATIDARTDIYAVGIVLYEMIVGDRPFHAEDTLQLLGMHRAAPIPRLADRVAETVELPPGLQALLDKAMAKAPADRFQSAIELAAAIDDLIAGKGIVVEEKRNTDRATAVAPTMLDIEPKPSRRARSPSEVPRPSRFWRGVVMAMVLVGGAAAMAGYLIHRNAEDEVVAAPVARDDAGVVAIATTADAASDEIGSGSDSGSGSASETATGSGSGSAAGSGSGSGSDVATSGSDAAEIEMDPNTAEDLDPSKGSGAAEDEAADAPKTTDEIERHATESPQLATTLPAAVQLITAGNRELALASLRVLRRKSPTSAYIPFLLGNLYYDQRWWSVAIDDYADAIKKNAAYRNNPTLNRNVIRMLASTKTRQKATNFLRGTIGHSARVYLQYAAAHEDNPVVRKQASQLVRYIH